MLIGDKFLVIAPRTLQDQKTIEMEPYWDFTPSQVQSVSTTANLIPYLDEMWLIKTGDDVDRGSRR